MRNIIFFIVAILCSLQSFGQQLKGQVVDQFNMPLENVYVINTTTNTQYYNIAKNLEISRKAKNLPDLPIPH